MICNKLSKCCCCMSLQTGTKIVGVFSMLGGIGGLALSLAQLTSFINAEYVIGGEILPSSLNQLTGSLVVIAFTASVLVAASKNGKPMLLVPWLVLKSISLFVAIFYSFYFGVSSVMTGDDQGMSYVSVLVIGIVLYSYFWLVVYSYYHELVTGMKKEALINEKC
ncbi:hypothetical protein DAPPUDRAFT_300228 [Daphnia pulex]|uniref:Uncharacterized protein n=1 Tax=Daphnia pulex TaxID=6669 RepID=E9G5G7_DAPPU|nr:hypothetical protein DAPPUDRAFT_300228 [Daphnia pulex]|eukprot:EFX85204.1 hypothetical protein DAPPUDRAFT_300228 [Daphnia pulex]